MTRLTYVGPHDGVELMLPDGGIATVARGDHLETTPDHAAALLEQPTNWQPAAPDKKAAADPPKAETTKDGD